MEAITTHDNAADSAPFPIIKQGWLLHIFISIDEVDAKILTGCKRVTPARPSQSVNKEKSLLVIHPAIKQLTSNLLRHDVLQGCNS
jgi:hypothetical protein